MFIKSDPANESQKTQGAFRNQANGTTMSKGGVMIVDQQEDNASELRSSVGGIIQKKDSNKMKSAISTGDTSIFKQVS